MKAIILYITFTISAILLCAEVSLTWLFLAALDAILIAWCYNNITLRELVKYSGYKTWYKMIYIKNR